jgi:hypothetical protein
VPIKRDSFSMEMVLIDDMMHPYGCRADAMLGHVASWGDRYPHAMMKGQLAFFVKQGCP